MRITIILWVHKSWSKRRSSTKYSYENQYNRKSGFRWTLTLIFRFSSIAWWVHVKKVPISATFIWKLLSSQINIIKCWKIINLVCSCSLRYEERGFSTKIIVNTHIFGGYVWKKFCKLYKSTFLFNEIMSNSIIALKYILPAGLITHIYYSNYFLWFYLIFQTIIICNFRCRRATIRQKCDSICAKTSKPVANTYIPTKTVFLMKKKVNKRQKPLNNRTLESHNSCSRPCNQKPPSHPVTQP